MKAKLTVLFSVFALAGAMVVYGTVAPGCDELAEAAGEVCGPCGEIEKGDATITGNAELDGIFKAVGTLKLTTGSIKGDFDSRVRALAEGVFGIDVEGKATADLVTEIKASYSAMISANVEGGVTVNFQPPKCQASLDVAVSASAQCEAKLDASCSAEVECDPGKLSFACEGSCSGSCEGTCEVPSCEVAVSGPSLACEGTCSGGCAVDVDAKCEGKCEGECSGECSAHNADGECSGTCSGTCSGKCEVKAEASCSGECRGSCKLTGPTATANCTGELKCEGKCEGSCSGGCTGEVKAPKCEGEVECNAEASAKCEAQASAQASASMECTPPTLELDYNFKAGVNAQAQAEFLAKLDKFRVEMIAIIQGTAKMRALVDANYAAELGITPPTVAIGASVSAFVDALGSGEIEIAAPGLALCAVPAFQDAAEILADLPVELAGTISAQLELVALVVPAGK